MISLPKYTRPEATTGQQVSHSSEQDSKGKIMYFSEDLRHGQVNLESKSLKPLHGQVNLESKSLKPLIPGNCD